MAEYDARKNRPGALVSLASRNTDNRFAQVSVLLIFVIEGSITGLCSVSVIRNCAPAARIRRIGNRFQPECFEFVEFFRGYSNCYRLAG